MSSHRRPRSLPVPVGARCARRTPCSVGATFALAALALCTLLASAPEADAGEGVNFRDTTLEAALVDAKKSDKVVVVDVYATWCGPCHMLDRETFPKDEVGALVEAHALALKIDAESEVGVPIAERYNVIAFPTILFIAPDGSEIDRITGFVSADDFVRVAGDFFAARNTLDDLVARRAETPDDPEVTHELFMRRIMRGEEAEAVALHDALRNHYDRALADDPKALADKRAELDLLLGKYLYLRSLKAHDKALALFEGIEKNYADSPSAARVFYPKARALVGLDRQDEAFATFQAMIDASPDEVGVYNTVAWFCYREKTRMDYGIDVATKGLELDPKQAGLWDTLAELHFANGDAERAIAAIDEAIALDDDPYYAGQRVRFAAK